MTTPTTNAIGASEEPGANLATAHDEYCSTREGRGACDCEAGRLAKMCEGMTGHQAEIAQSWEMLEGFGFPPEACGWPMRDITGLLPEAIKCALECLVRQREDLLAEISPLRAAHVSNGHRGGEQ